MGSDSIETWPWDTKVVDIDLLVLFMSILSIWHAVAHQEA